MTTAGGATARAPLRLAIRIAFVVYALVLVTLTHWPGLAIEGGEIPRPDLFVHFGAFGLWTVLCAGSGWFGPPLSFANLTLSLTLAFAYAMLDELSQAFPALRRYSVLDDLLANWGGITLAMLALITLRLCLPRSRRADSKAS